VLVFWGFVLAGPAKWAWTDLFWRKKLLEYSKTGRLKPLFSSFSHSKPAKEADPEPEKQPKTSPAKTRRPRVGGLVFATKFQYKNAHPNRPTDLRQKPPKKAATPNSTDRKGF
jgi:hypothetical protein